MSTFDVRVPAPRVGTAGPGVVGALPLAVTGGGLIGPIANPSPGAGDWRVALLDALGAPVTDGNLKALAYWHQSEGTAAATNNPLAISDGANRYPHAGCLAQCGGSSPIYAFPDQATGVAATAHFLQGSYYSRVVGAFKANGGLAAIFAAINSSPWCAGCQSGHYPIALYNAVGNPNAPDPGPGGKGGSTPVVIGPKGLPGPSDPVPPSDCLIGGWTVHNPAPGLPNVDVPCLFPKSWGWAVVGALSMVAGSLLITVGGILLVSSSKTVGQAVGSLGGPLAKAASAGSTSGSVTRRGSVRPLQTQEQVDENRHYAEQEREVNRQKADPEFRRRARRTADNPQAARARRTPRQPVTREEPF